MNVCTIFLVTEQRIDDSLKEHHENNAGNTNGLKWKCIARLLRMKKYVLLLSKNLSRKPIYVFLLHSKEQTYLYSCLERNMERMDPL